MSAASKYRLTAGAVRANADDPGAVALFTGDNAPDGHHVVLVRYLGVAREYLCAGPAGDDTAPVVGRVDLVFPVGDAYTGGRMLGGSLLPNMDRAAAYARMVEAAR